MSSEMALAIRQLIQERGISEELVLHTIEDTLLAAYKRKYGTVDNAVVRFADDGTDVSIYAQKKIVPEDEIDDPALEMSLQDALEYNDDAELGDELLIEINPRDFDRVSIQSAKQKARQSLREIQKDTLYSEFKDREGELIVGYYQRERNGTIFVDLGRTEGILPRRYQSPREIYRANDRVRAMIYEVEKSTLGLQIVLTRTHTEFVKKIFELEVPEIYDRTIEIHKMVREPGYRTKMSVYSTRDDVDPVGACVGMRGVRIQTVVRELEGEKIDVLRYDPGRAFVHHRSLEAGRGRAGHHPRRGEAAGAGGGAREPILPGHRQAGLERAAGQPADRLEHRRAHPHAGERDEYRRRIATRGGRSVRRRAGGDHRCRRAARYRAAGGRRLEGGGRGAPGNAGRDG